MKVRLQIQTPNVVGAELLFETLNQGWPSFRGIGFSLLTHTAAVWLLLLVSFPQPRASTNLYARYEDRQIRIGDHLYYVAPLQPREVAHAPAPRAAARRAPSPAPAPLEAQKKVEEQRNEPAPRTFIPPEFKRNPLAQQTLIQPDSPPDLQLQESNLPTFRMWSAEIPKIPKPFVAPGRRVTTPEQPQLLAEPNFELTHPARQANLVAHLTLPPAPAPLDLPPAPEIPQLQSGDPVNIVSISSQPALPVDVLKVPPGNVVSADQGRSGGAGSQRTPGPDRADRNTNSSAAGSTNVSASSSTSVSASDANARATAPGTAKAAAESNPSAAGIASAGAARAPDMKQQVILRPANGHFDTMIVQSSPLDLFPEGRNLLSGRPVYTVYVAVGSAKDWPLYFCIPEEQTQHSPAVPGIVELAAPPPVRAPYPTRIVRPLVPLPKYEKYILLHGLISEAGRFRDIRVVNPGAAETDEAIVAAINAWEFRPADRDGVPVAVEVLLAIPAGGL